MSARCCCRDDSLTLCIGDVVSSRSCCLGCARGDLLPDGAPLERTHRRPCPPRARPLAQAKIEIKTKEAKAKAAMAGGKGKKKKWNK